MEEIEAFIAVIEAGSQTAAARRLGRSLQSVNRSLVALERSVGVELVRRTTRRSFATEAGLAFYRRVKPAVAEIGEARLEAASRRDEPSGLLRIAAPVQFAAAFVVPAVAQFMRRYPRIEVDLKASDQAVDVVGEGVDLAVRIRELPDSSLKARRLGQLRTVVYGAPGYFARHGRPRQPDDLADHQCVVRAFGPRETETWRFRAGRQLKPVRTPLLRLPDEPVVFVLNLIRIPASNDRAAAERMVAHNRVLYERIRDRGGVLYPVSALPMSADDWQRHFGAAWPGFQDARRRYDPAGILTPGYLSKRA